MATDYILFIHGVNTREQQAQPSYANDLIKLLDRAIASHAPTLHPKYIPLYWGDTLYDEQQKRLNKFRASSQWNRLWFPNFRSKQLMQFIGDATLYINRHVGAKVVEELARQIEANLPSHPQLDDRLHIVGHSCAWALKEVMQEVVGNGLVKIEDVIIKDTDLTDLLMLPFRQSPVSLLINGGDAHGSYWRCRDVVQKMSSAIASSRMKQAAIA